MDNNPIYKHSASEYFRGVELSVAEAIRKNDTDLMDAIVRKNPYVNLNTVGNEGMTLLFWACAHRQPKVVERLLQLRANPNQLIDDGKTKTHLVAVCAGGIVDRTLELLLEYGGDPNGMDDGISAAQIAVKARRLDRVKLLLSKGANIDIINRNDESLIQYCAIMNQFEVVAYLIEQGADFKRKDKIGGSVALEIQETKGKVNEPTEVWRSKVEKMLIERGVVFPVERPWEKKK